jgi:hypothetical protein
MLKYKKLVLIGIIFLILRITVFAFTVSYYKPVSSTYGMIDGVFYNWDGLAYQNASGCYMNIINDEEVQRKFGFGITSDQANISTADFDCDWSFDGITDTWTASYSSGAFTWNIDLRCGICSQLMTMTQFYTMTKYIQI